jgi:EAL domain-containing protein (putative c-di-GMP-specific phosphodiesterase class I)/CheY-like chemotaxis protein
MSDREAGDAPMATVLVVDDEPAVRRLLSRVLTRRGFAVLQAADGAEALNTIEASAVDLVLLDHVLPDQSGTAVLIQIRSNPATITLPVILVTGNADPEHRVAGLEAGANDYLAKPVDLDELVARVRSHLRGRDAWRDEIEAKLHERVAMAGALASVPRAGSLGDVANGLVSVLVTMHLVEAAAVLSVSIDGSARYLAAVDSSGALVNTGSPVAGSVLAELNQALAHGTAVLPADPHRQLLGTSTGASVVVAVRSASRSAALVLGTALPDDLQRSPGLREVLSAAIDLAGVVEQVIVPADEPADHQLHQVEELRAVIDDVAFHPVFQPIVELHSGMSVGFEALTRFADGVPPDRRFVEAMHLGMGTVLELATLHEALEHARRLPPDTYLSVNVSASLLSSPELPAMLDAADGRALVLELTEHERIDDYDEIRRAVAAVGDHVRMSVDDAGSGWASLRHVLTLRPDFVKLDRAWVSGLDADPARQALLLGIGRFVAELGGAVVAEGIETAAELEALLRLGIPFGQGYHLGRPVPIAQVVA